MSGLAKVNTDWELRYLSPENLAMVNQIDVEVQAKKHSDCLEIRRMRYRARRAKNKKEREKK